jgi:hypothetical protein
LDRASGAVEIRLGDCGSTEHPLGRLPAIAEDAEPERRFSYALDLQLEEVAPPLVHVLGLAKALALDQRADPKLRQLLPNDDEPPRLHVADRRREVGGLEDTVENLLRDGIGTKTPDVAPGAQRQPKAIAESRRKAPAVRLAPSD